MPNRMIRDGLLESEAVLSLPVEARWLYVSILLSADDIGLFEATPFRLARRADVRREHADKLLQMIADADLVRLYQADGKRYGFIPRFGQRLQIKRIKHAPPPEALLQDEIETLNKIKHLTSKTTDVHGCADVGQRCSTVAQPSEPEPEPEPEEEKKKEEHFSGNVVAAEPEKAPRKRSAATGSRLSADWALPMAWGQWALQEVPGFTTDVVRLEASKFADFWHSKAGRDANKADWFATWRNWCRNAKPNARASAAAGAQQTEEQRNAELRRILGFAPGDVDVIEGDAREA